VVDLAGRPSGTLVVAAASAATAAGRAIRELIALLRECLSGDTVTFSGDYSLRKFRLGVELGDRKPKIIPGALGEGMLSLAGAER
jgi:alkanesulfonate monooxygenase SsuD/methylene tetrahydromethanopterin reductase-like flavin-dependent oxidoreductase (luciferase family)